MNGEAGTRKQINSPSAVTCATDLGPSMRGQTSILRRFLLLEIMKEPGPQSPLWGSTGVSGGQRGESTLYRGTEGKGGDRDCGAALGRC